jgi:hypothetical protein
MAGFFNTSWDLSNSFNSPFTNNQMVGGNLSTEITPRPGNEGPDTTESFTNTWGAPTGYMGQQQGNNIFNPYQANTSGGFYNPYQFGQMQYGTQYGGGQEMPWWMNYNVNNPFMPTQPTPSVQPQLQPQTPRRPQGTGPDGKDLTYDETIKYFGLYDGAENAFAAGDSQAAYRQDHMQWRSGTGAWEGKGKKEGESDLDYPGRTTDAGDVIMGDRQKLASWSGMLGEIPDNLKALFSGSQDNEILNATPAIGGGSGFTQVPDMFRTGNTNPFNVPYGPQPMSMQNYLDDSQIFNKYTVSDLEQAQASGLTDTNRVEVISPLQWDLRFNPIPDMFKTGNMNPFNVPYGPKQGGVEQNYVSQDASPLIMSSPMTPEEQALKGTNRGLFIPPMLKTDNNLPFGPNTIPYGPQNIIGIGKDNFVPETRYGPNNSRQLVESNLLGFPTPTPTENAYAQRRFLLMEQEREKQAAMAESKRAAEEYEAKNRAEAAAKAAADAAAAQKRKNDNYETGYVPPNRYTTKDVNNSFAARRDIRNIFA